MCHKSVCITTCAQVCKSSLSLVWLYFVSPCWLSRWFVFYQVLKQCWAECIDGAERDTVHTVVFRRLLTLIMGMNITVIWGFYSFLLTVLFPGWPVPHTSLMDLKNKFEFILDFLSSTQGQNYTCNLKRVLLRVIWLNVPLASCTSTRRFWYS